MKRNAKTIYPSLLALLLLAAGCSNAAKPADSTGAAAEPPKPVTLKLYTEVPMSDQDYAALIEQPVKQKYPHITLVRSGRDNANDGGDINKKVAAGYVPDIIFSGNYYLGNYSSLGLVYPMDDLLKKQGIELGKFNPSGIEALRTYSPEKKLYALPFSFNTVMLFYNKDIFDRFAVPYPKDTLSWDEAVELARKLTREVDGTAYQGISPGNWTQQRSQLSLDFVDPKSNKVIFESDPGYKKVFELYQSIYSIPGMLTTLNTKDGFFKSRQFAMYVNWLTDVLYMFEDADKSGSPLNWDMMRLPYFTEKPGIGSKVDVHMLMVTAQSKQKDEAAAVVGFLTSSETVQTAAARTGRIPAIQSGEAQKQFGANYASVKNKNTKAVFETKMAPLWNYSPYDVQAMYPPIEQAVRDVMNKKSDINTALKAAAEKTNKLIEENPAH